MSDNHSIFTTAKTLHGKFYENALEHPERVALIYGHERVSYKILRTYALSAANYMAQQGVKKGDKVAVILPRGIGQIAALLGILAVGAVYVPISIKQPMARLEKIIKNVKPTIVLQDENFLNEKPWDGDIEDDPEASAYIIYTSGSSGNPKGVDMSHAAAMNTIEVVLRMWNIGAGDSILNISSFDFDLSVFDIFGLLSAGGTVVLVDEKDYRDPEVWEKLLKNHGITIWNSAPALLDMLLTLKKNNCHFEKLRLALVSGDWIPLYLPKAWYEVAAEGSQFVAMGGATEGGIWSNYYCVSEVDKSWKSIPYGQALPEQTYRIVNENLEECEVNVPGELLIGGGSLANGYINDEKLTNRKFIIDKGERWYKTGDCGMYGENRIIEFLGRMEDTQVKIKGHRIELGEIENILKEFPGVKEAVVVTQGDNYHKELAAFYSGHGVIKSNMEHYLELHLPEYSIPNSIIQIDSFPLSENGKVDRKKLKEYKKVDNPEMFFSESSSIALIVWEELLEHRVTDLDENLFKMGADSLLAARFVETIRKRYGVKIHMKDIFEKPTIRELSEWIEKQEDLDILEPVEEGEI